MLVEVTQFKYPHGIPVEGKMQVNDSLAAKYEAIKQANCRLTAECLPGSSEVSFAVEHDKGDFDIELCQNEPGKPTAAIESLLGRFDADNFSRFLGQA